MIISPSSTRAFLRTFALILSGIAISSGVACAQAPSPILDPETAGRAYIIAFPDTTANALDPRYPNTRGPRSEFSLWIYSAVKNKVRIIQGGGGTTVLDAPAGRFKIFNFTGSPVVTSINTKTNNTYRVESDFPVIIYCYLATIQGLEAWTPIPIDRWGKEYHSASVSGEVVREIGAAGNIVVPYTPKMGSAEILMLAAYDNTRITLRPPPGVDFLGGPPRDITLNAGQAYQVQSIVDVDLEGAGQPDIAATVITSDKPIGILSGNTRVQINYDETGLKNNAYKNMLMEWLTPSEQHGKEFVFMPTWDNVRPGSGAAAERKREYVRLYSTQGKETPGFYLQPGGTTQVPFTAVIDSLREFVFGNPAAVCIRTDIASQALMHSSAIVKFNGSTPCFGGIPCLSYDAWAPYMVELVPREQWTTFAPYYAPVNPGGMLHYLNVVADTISAQNIYRESGSRFLFTRKIPGTDLIWGSVPVNPGQDNYLVGRNGARFFAFAYGMFKGFEEYRPGRTKRDDDDQHAIAGGGDDAPVVAHPAEYEEYNALAYGYPLAPGRNLLAPSDSLRIDTTMDCWRLEIDARAVNENPNGFLSVALEPDSTTNARLVPVDPLRFSDILGRSYVKVAVEPLDPLQNAGATVLLKDRTGRVWKVNYKYEAEYVTIDSATGVNFGFVVVNREVERTVTITNPLQKSVEVKDLRLALGNQNYTIVRSTPAGPLLVPPMPVKLGPGEKMTVVIRVKPTIQDQIYVDTVKVVLSCTRMMLPLITETIGSTAGPQITGYDWKERWVTAKETGNCTKNMEPFYVGEISIENLGTSSFSVKSLELIGADSAFFEFDFMTDPLSAIRPGDEFRPETPPRRQLVRFMPKEERIYFVRARLTTENDEVVESSLTGIGVESHGSITGATFDHTLACPPAQVKDVIIRARPTRPLTITTIQINGADASCFTMEPTGIALPVTLNPGDSLVIPVSFCGNGSQGCAAQIEFTGNHALCDDSAGVLDASPLLSVPLGGALEDLRVHRRDGDDAVEITCTIPAAAHLRLEIFDALGRPVSLPTDGPVEAGPRSIRWSTAGVASGIYYGRLVVGEWSRTVPIVIRK